MILVCVVDSGINSRIVASMPGPEWVRGKLRKEFLRRIHLNGRRAFLRAGAKKLFLKAGRFCVVEGAYGG